MDQIVDLSPSFSGFWTVLPPQFSHLFAVTFLTRSPYASVFSPLRLLLLIPLLLLLPPVPPRHSLQEDKILLNHVMRYGSRYWGLLQATGQLPLRDQKSCCNRFLLLKK